MLIRIDRTMRTGFTAIEIMVVMAISAILLTLGIAQYGNMRAGASLTTEAEELFADIKYTRQLGISTSASSITFTSSGYIIRKAGGSIVKNKSLSSFLSLSVSPSTAATITFSSNGSCDYSATATLTCARLGRTKSISITAATGMIVKN